MPSVDSLHPSASLPPLHNAGGTHRGHSAAGLIRSAAPLLLTALGLGMLAPQLPARGLQGQHGTGDPALDPGTIPGDRPRAGGGLTGDGAGGDSAGDGAGATGGLGDGGGSSGLADAPGSGSPTPPGASPPPGVGVGSNPAGTTGTLPATLAPWEHWWNLHRQEFLRPRLAEVRTPPTTGPSDFEVSSEGVEDPAPGHERAPLALPDGLLPALLLAADDSDPRLAYEALLALGELSDRWPEATDRRSIRAVIGAGVRSSNRSVSEAALTALAVGADDGDLALLGSLATDATAGRTYLAAATVDADQRTIAAIGLGRIASTTDREDVRRLALHYLLRTIETAPRNAPEIAATGLVMMAQAPLERIDLRDPAGVPEPPNHSRLALLRFFVGKLEGRKRLDDLVAAHCPPALALGFLTLDQAHQLDLAEGLAEPLVKLLERPRREADATVQNAALAAGALLDWDDSRVDDDIRAALFETSDAADAQTRACAIFALGRGLSTPGAGPRGSGWEEAAEHLLELLERGSTADRPAVALAIGAAGARLAAAGDSIPPAWTIAVRAALAEARGSGERVALCLAAGLLSDRGAEELILDAYGRASSGADRSRIALALGLIESRGALAILRDDLDERLADYRAASRLALAAALCGDSALSDRLVDRLASDASRVHRIALINSLGELGEAEFIPELLDCLVDETRDAGERAHAVRAIARLAETESEPWPSELARQLAPGGTVRPLGQAFARLP